MRRLPCMALLAAAAFILFDHVMRLDQRALCLRSDAVQCPGGLWIWESFL